jgi:2,4-dienoyl-CoA reductase-like NADH-dependent reductase (Old Yellow Enzyme family)
MAGAMALFLTGGMRLVSFMEKVLEKGKANFICISRPSYASPTW